jgi:ribosomal protein S27AE
VSVNNMFCPRCGSGDQEPESYCRNCGEFLLDHTGRSFLLNKLLGGSAPTTQIYVNLALDLITIFTSFLLIGFLNGYYDALEERTGEGTPNVIYLVYAFLVVISFWQFLSLIVGVRLKTKLGRKRATGGTIESTAPEDFLRRETEKLLPLIERNETLPLSVTEDSTRILENAKRK